MPPTTLFKATHVYIVCKKGQCGTYMYINYIELVKTWWYVFFVKQHIVRVNALIIYCQRLNIQKHANNLIEFNDILLNYQTDYNRKLHHKKRCQGSCFWHHFMQSVDIGSRTNSEAAFYWNAISITWRGRWRNLIKNSLEGNRGKPKGGVIPRGHIEVLL